MALLQEYKRNMGTSDPAKAQAGGVLRPEAKHAPTWALSADGVTGKTFDDHGVRRVRQTHFQDAIQGGRVVASCKLTEGDIILREAYLHAKFGAGGLIDARLTGDNWYVLLEFGERETWVVLADCRGLGGSVSFKPGRSQRKPENIDFTPRRTALIDEYGSLKAAGLALGRARPKYDGPIAG